MIWLADPDPVDSMVVTSLKPPIRLAMSPDGGPSSVVTTPRMSRSPWGVMCMTRSAEGSTWPTAASVVSDTALPNTSSPVMTMNPTG